MKYARRYVGSGHSRILITIRRKSDRKFKANVAYRRALIWRGDLMSPSDWHSGSHPIEKIFDGVAMVALSFAVMKHPTLVDDSDEFSIRRTR